MRLSRRPNNKKFAKRRGCPSCNCNCLRRRSGSPPSLPRNTRNQHQQIFERALVIRPLQLMKPSLSTSTSLMRTRKQTNLARQMVTCPPHPLTIVHSQNLGAHEKELLHEHKIGHEQTTAQPRPTNTMATPHAHTHTHTHHNVQTFSDVFWCVPLAFALCGELGNA